MNHINRLNIKYFKSIKNLNLRAKRVNVFIGEPNSGKTNILEALCFFAMNNMDGNNFKQLIRHRKPQDLFFDSDISRTIEVNTNLRIAKFHFAKDEKGSIYNQFWLDIYNVSNKKPELYRQRFSKTGEKAGTPEGMVNLSTNFLNYSFKRLFSFSETFRPFLDPPYGENLPQLLLTNPKLKKRVSDFLKSKGYKLQLKQIENDLEVVKEKDEVLYPLPFVMISETMQRMIILTLAIESNNNCVIILDEPEANTFPFYTAHFAERIARDSSNQYFLTTHNPYLLFKLIEKTPERDLNIILTKMKNYETSISLLNKKQKENMSEAGADIFFNLDSLTK